MSGPPPPTPEQAQAIELRDRDVFCEAGAGSGKTRVLVGRYCGALLEDGVPMDRILAFTFTERAAAELRHRVRAELTRAAERAESTARAHEIRELARETDRAWVTTIHGFCRRVLATHPVAAGLDPRFRVLDAAEAERMRERAALEAVDALVEAGDDEVARAAAAYKPGRFARMALAAHERLRNQGMERPRLPEVGEPKRSGKDEAEPLTPAERTAALAARDALERVLVALTDRYDELKAARSGLDFLDLELRALALLRESEAVAARWRERFEHVLVDEFQDTNRVQLALVECLRGPDTRVFTVGDEHQSVYRFRNADLEVFREARRRAQADPETAVLPLRGNFRSAPEVLAAANAVGGALIDDFPKLQAGAEPAGAPRAELLLTFEEGGGKKHRKWQDEDVAEALDPPASANKPRVVAEARALAARLRELVEAGEARPGEIVVLLRAFTHVDAYEDALRRLGLDPYVVGGRGYWSQQQVEDLLRLLGVVANPLDDELLFGALASPACGVTPDTLWLLRRAAGKGRHVWPALAAAFGEGERGEDLDTEAIAAIETADADKLRAFCETLAGLRAEAPLLALDALVERTMDAFRYDLTLLARRQGAGRMANVRKLMRLAAEFERNEGRDLRGFLDQATAATERDEREGLAPVQPEDHDGVRIMTVHGAKGLEFPVVAVPDLGRSLSAGHRSGDLWIGRLEDGGRTRFGLRLAFSSEESFGVWELAELDAEEREAEAEEVCRLVYVAATRAERHLILSGAYKPGDLEPLEEPTGRETALRRLLPALRELGWDGEPGSIPLEPPAPVGDRPRAERASLEITISAPSVERARELARQGVAADGAPPPLEAERPPIVPARRSPVPLGHLSYSALDAYKRCGYRFYVERVLGLRQAVAAAGGALAAESGEPDEDLDERSADELHQPSPGDDAGTRARGLGNAVHAVLEWSARNGWAQPHEALLTGLLHREGVDDDATRDRAAALIAGWLGSDLCAQTRGLRLRPEAPFVLPLGSTVLRGSIDLLADDAGEPHVIDFKTDRVDAGGVAELGERYAEQRAVYALAAAAVYPEARSIKATHVFLERPTEPVVERFDADALALARRRLEALVERIRSGHFEVTREPFAALCLGCPAAARLCPRPAWRPRRAGAAAAA